MDIYFMEGGIEWVFLFEPFLYAPLVQVILSKINGVKFSPWKMKLFLILVYLVVLYLCTTLDFCLDFLSQVLLCCFRYCFTHRITLHFSVCLTRIRYLKITSCNNIITYVGVLKRGYNEQWFIENDAPTEDIHRSFDNEIFI